MKSYDCLNPEGIWYFLKIHIKRACVVFYKIINSMYKNTILSQKIQRIAVNLKKHF